MPLKPEIALRKMLQALERHKDMLDIIGTFLKAHPDIVGDCSLHQLTGKLGLKFGEYALAVPYNKKGGGFTLRLIKSGEDWINNHDYEELYGKRLVAEDITGISDDQLEKLLNDLYEEANPGENLDQQE